MSKFVKLTHKFGDPTWTNVGRAIGITTSNGVTTIHFGQNEYTEVTETPEQILALIEAAGGE